MIGRRILITGGTGSFGKKFVSTTAIDRKLFESRQWLFKGDSPAIARLSFSVPALAPALHQNNVLPRDAVISDMLANDTAPLELPCCLGGGSDIVIAEVDRFGIPIRTVLSKETGLMRSDPYYSNQYLSHFYAQHYRPLYTKHRRTEMRLFREQIEKGERIQRFAASYLHSPGKVLDIGCGLGGSLVPFAMSAWEVVGCDFGADHIDRGRCLGLNLIAGEMETAAEFGPFQLVILSHVLEHVRDPIAFLRRVRNLVANDGYLYVGVPAISSIQTSYGYDIQRFLQNAHAWYFSKPSLQAVLRRSGFSSIACSDSLDLDVIAHKITIDEDSKADGGERILNEILGYETKYLKRERLKKFAKVLRIR